MTRALHALALLLVTASAFARDAIVKPVDASTEIGTLEGTAYRIDIPERWNHGLVVFYHGYSPTPVTFGRDEPISPMFDGMLARGFAVIQSAYSATGWAVEEGSYLYRILHVRRSPVRSPEDTSARTRESRRGDVAAYLWQHARRVAAVTLIQPSSVHTRRVA